MKKEFIEVMFWNGNEALLFGTQSKFVFDTMEEAKVFVNGFNCNCSEVSFNTFLGSQLIDSKVYEVLVE